MDLIKTSTYLTPLALSFILFGGVADAATPIHAYELNGDLSDSLGGPALVSEGGMVGASTYEFGGNEGLTLFGPDLTNPARYSIEMMVSLNTSRADTGVPWIKLIDFQDLDRDEGLYSYDPDNTVGAKLQFWPYSSTADAFFPGEFVHVVITRDDTTDEVIGYAKGVGQLTFDDTASQAVFSGIDNVMRFLQDDGVTGFNERGGGSLDFIRIYDVVLTPEEVEQLNEEAQDADGDGFASDEDCDDDNADVYPGAPEICDGLDNDCDGDVPADELDGDGDGVIGCADNCPDVANADQADADGDADGDACDVCPYDPYNDLDLDGVCGDADECAEGTVADEPTRGLLPNHWSYDGQGSFSTMTRGRGRGTGASYDIQATYGCSCEQIVAICGYGDGHLKHGCSNSVMEIWVDSGCKDE